MKTRLFSSLARFTSSESGAITVDWVTITAAIAALGIAVVSVIGDGSLEAADKIGTHMESTEVGFTNN